MEKNRHNARTVFQSDVPPLCQAAMTGNLEMVEYLLESGVDVDSTAKGGMTALMLAALFAHEKIVAKLLKYGANNELRNEGGFTARDMVDPKSTLTLNTPYYDLSSCKIRKTTRDENLLRTHTNEHSNHQRADRGESILKRRNKSLPKINIQECSSQFVSNHVGQSIRSHSAHMRYSPYPKTTPKLNCTPEINQNLQNLSPNVAKFFGNVLQVKSPCLTTTNDDDEVFENSIGSPVLRKFLNDHGFNNLIDLFERQEINFQIFSTLNDMDLQQIGVRSVTHRKKLLALIKRIHQ